MQSLCRCVWLSAVFFSCALLLLLLLLPLDASVDVRRRGCGGDRSNGDDHGVGWKTLRAAVVFEGEAKLRASVPGQPHLNSVEFKVHQVFKGDRVKRSQRVSVVGFFAESDSEVTRVSVGSRYLVFVDGRVDPGDGVVFDSTWKNSTSPPPFYRLSSSPEEFSNKAVKEVRSHACRKCARSPRISKQPKREEEKREGQRLRLHCRAAGRPLPCITWYKDGVELKTEKRLTIRGQGRDSRLQIRNIGALDSGIYRCQATNALGNSSSGDVIVTVRQVAMKPHSSPCRNEKYCLNGGKCYKVSQLKKTYCECVNNFTGLRCEEKLAAGTAQAAVGKGGETFKKKRKRKRGLEESQQGHHHQHHVIGS